MSNSSLLADRTDQMGADVIREIIKVVSQPGEGLETMRHDFSMTDENTIELAVKILSEVISKKDNHQQKIGHLL
jgi:hypothetical protein